MPLTTSGPAASSMSSVVPAESSSALAKALRSSVSLISRCAECGAVWLPADPERWEAYHTDDESPELAFFCPDCAEREFAAG